MARWAAAPANVDSSVSDSSGAMLSAREASTDHWKNASVRGAEPARIHRTTKCNVSISTGSQYGEILADKSLSDMIGHCEGAPEMIVAFIGCTSTTAAKAGAGLTT